MVAAGLTFDEARHAYTLAGRPVPSVTTILNTVFPRSWNCDDWYLTRGSALHAAIQLKAADKLDVSSVDESYRPRLAAFERFVSETGYAVLESEMRLGSTTYQYAGTADALLALPDGRVCLADWKSSVEGRVELQLGAYNLALKETRKLAVEVGIAVELRGDGTYRMHPFQKRLLDRFSQEFLGVLTAYNAGTSRKLYPTQTKGEAA